MTGELPRARLGRRAVEVTRLGLGTAPLGGWPAAVSEADGLATIEAAWQCGVRYFDTAPFYGYGRSERWLGEALAGRPRDEFVLSTKVGRVIRPARVGEPQLFVDAGDLATDFDFSRDATLRSIDDSLGRLGMDRVDVALIHDPQDHLDQAADGAFAALAELRDAGTMSAVGIAMNFTAPLAELVRRTDVDCVLLAGRYTLLEHGALDDLLPLLVERNISMVVGGAFNSGILADPRPGAMFHYAPAPDDAVDRAQRIRDICAADDVEIGAAALRFPLAHPAVAAVVAGARAAEEIRRSARLATRPIPARVWTALRSAGLLPADTPVPA